MGNKLNIKFKDSGDTLADSLCISEERAKELQYRVSLIAHEITKPRRETEPGIKSDTVIKMCIALAEDIQELVFCAYSSGIIVGDVFATEDQYDEE